MVAKIKLGKWGNSIGLRIPKDIAEALSLAEETEVKLIQSGDRLIIEPIKQQKKYSLDGLLQNMTKDNLHNEIEWGNSQGQEWW